ncbi:pyridoxamine 5'-phosphate oxidase family protein [Mesonia ostreae]|uniref:Pyridoxamine 5'-phosphate oxidase family protein n=1 Tax=Mesonia ostreae TaxID=861110 RepID=A0ABU2KHW5_9FLAO|nr:pyridoxamine 5'-phosphate oxidase family protein [Mesonia ostreae]MDT0294295.1 pyridoxamine 5'-phosphate oxidase family protein [Mesonia ostreae]
MYGYSKKRHPFHYFVLATIENGVPRQRTVVLRKTLADLSIVFYTDKRTQKLNDIQQNPMCSALFYCPKKLLQVRINGKASLINNKDEIATYWQGIQQAAKNDYTTKLASTPIKNPDDISYNAEKDFFCALKIVPDTIEYLRLKRPNHLRVLFSKIDSDWSGEFWCLNFKYKLLIQPNSRS